ncbi:MAG: hypothetical protein LBL32_00485, partial [Holosporales bacterium]|nr:hypothetical protein [Holosporales bacterium]
MSKVAVSKDKTIIRRRKKNVVKSESGIVTQVIGAVIDVYFEGELPSILHALKLKIGDNEKNRPSLDEEKAEERSEVGIRYITLEVLQHIGERVVRTIAMSSTDGVARGMEVINTKAPISVPVGRATLGRVLNVTGDPIDHGPSINARTYFPIHRDAPAFAEQSTKTEVLTTGIKV